MPQRFDLILLGTGPSASRIASACAKKFRVAMVDSREMGGTCAAAGCNPKKVFTRAAELADWARRSEGQLVSSHELKIDWKQLIDFKRTFTDPVPEKSAASFRDQGIALFHGTARFSGPQTVGVGDGELTADTIVICTGAKPVKLDIPGEEHVTLSDQFMELESLPPRVVFIGGGYISFEFAHVARRAGAEVTMVDRGKRPLEEFEADMVTKLVAYSRKLEIDIREQTEVKQVIEQTDGSLEVVVQSQSGGEQRIAADLVVHGAGRVPAIADLDLPAGNIEATSNGVKVNKYLQSITNSHVYAAGDCADTAQPKLTPVANRQGRTISKTLLEGMPQEVQYGAVPAVVFTVPELASIGLTEEQAKEQAKEQGLRFEVKHDDMSDWTAVRKVGGPAAAYKILIEEETDRLLGAHLLGPGAGESINLFALAMTHDLTASQMKGVLFAFPTFAADVRTML